MGENHLFVIIYNDDDGKCRDKDGSVASSRSQDSTPQSDEQLQENSRFFFLTVKNLDVRYALVLAGDRTVSYVLGR